MIEYSFTFQEFEYFLLVLVRVSFFVFSAPFFSMNNTPRRARVALSVFIAYLLYYATLPHEAVIYNTLLEYVAILLKEGIVGLFVGLGANICTSIVLFAGRVIDMEIGFSMASQMDPTTKEQSTVTGVYYQYMVMLMLLISGMHRYLLQALAETYILIPVNRVQFDVMKLSNAFISFMSDYLSIGFRICLPVFCVMMLLNVVLGILAKVAPQMNMFAVGMQIKILTGLGVLFLTVGLMPYISNFVFTEMKKMVVAFVKAMT